MGAQVGGGRPEEAEMPAEAGRSRHRREREAGGFRRNGWRPEPRGGRGYPHRREGFPEGGPGR